MAMRWAEAEAGAGAGAEEGAEAEAEAESISDQRGAGGSSIGDRGPEARGHVDERKGCGGHRGSGIVEKVEKAPGMERTGATRIGGRMDRVGEGCGRGRRGENAFAIALKWKERKDSHRDGRRQRALRKRWIEGEGIAGEAERGGERERALRMRWGEGGCIGDVVERGESGADGRTEGDRGGQRGTDVDRGGKEIG